MERISVKVKHVACLTVKADLMDLSDQIPRAPCHSFLKMGFSHRRGKKSKNEKAREVYLIPGGTEFSAQGTTLLLFKIEV